VTFIEDQQPRTLREQLPNITGHVYKLWVSYQQDTSLSLLPFLEQVRLAFYAICLNMLKGGGREFFFFYVEKG
jgi:hypothetical protein